jgi:hypothetical protein
VGLKASIRRASSPIRRVYYFLGTHLIQDLAIPLVLEVTFGWGLDLKVTGIWLAFGIPNGFLLVYFVYSLLTTDWEV